MQNRFELVELRLLLRRTELLARSELLNRTELLARAELALFELACAELVTIWMELL